MSRFITVYYFLLQKHNFQLVNYNIGSCMFKIHVLSLYSILKTYSLYKKKQNKKYAHCIFSLFDSCISIKKTIITVHLTGICCAFYFYNLIVPSIRLQCTVRLLQKFTSQCNWTFKNFISTAKQCSHNMR